MENAALPLACLLQVTFTRSKSNKSADRAPEGWPMRLSIDVGGTFTDILLTSSGGRAEAFKASTTYPDPIEGIVAGLELAAAIRGFSVQKLLGETEHPVSSRTD